jgi:DNA-binding beta-propeller fold protein YncE
MILLFILGISACTEKFDISEVNSSNNGEIGNIGDTLYIQQSPNWTGFNNPQDMIIGNDLFIYVADTDNDRIVMLDIAGQVLGDKPVKKPIALAQNYKLELLVVADFDTVINNQDLTFSALYKINLVETGHILSNAKLVRLLPQNPKIDPFAFNRTDRFYTGVCVFYDNSIYVSRKGPSNSNPVDRDNTIIKLKFTENESMIVSKIPGLEPEGTGILSANKISSLTSFNRKSTDIILTLIGNNSFKVQWLEFVSNQDFEGYLSKLGAFSCDLMSVNKFGQPEDVALDEANNIYVADSEKDSVYKFNIFGDEMESFGGAEIMSSPHAVAHHDRTLYVLDTDNNRILRFILSTEID